MLLPLLLTFAAQTAPDAVAPPPPTPAVAKTPAEDTSDIPNGAPTDDYGFVSWCRGALSGHMQLYPSVKDELHQVELEKAAKEDARYTTDAQRDAAKVRRAKEATEDAKLDGEQLDAGKMYLKLYSDALDAAEAASAANLHERGVETQDAGYRIWSAARGAEPRTRMWSWIMWELPARCETAAKRLKDRSLLLGGALKGRVEARADAPATPEAAPEAKIDATPVEVAVRAAAADPSLETKPAEVAAPAAPSPKAEAEAATPAPDAKVPETASTAAPGLRGELAPTPLADAPVARRESDETSAPAPSSPSEAPKP